MEGTYDDDFHRDQGYDTFDDWLADQPEKDYDYLYEYDHSKIKKVNFEKSFRDYLKKFKLRECSDTKCQGTFVLKFNSLKKSLFWGCSNYPNCKLTTSVMSNIQTITKCNCCSSYYKVNKIISNNKLSLKCNRQWNNHVIVITVDDDLSEKY